MTTGGDTGTAERNMPTANTLPVILLISVWAAAAYADGGHAEGHAGAVYHAFRVEAGAGSNDNGESVIDWDLDGWIGTDENKLRLETEGERSDTETEQAEFLALHSRTITKFWDMQIGIRHDMQPQSLTYGIFGFQGLAPYFLETKARLFVSEDDDVSFRLKQKRDFLFTQKLTADPYLEFNFYAQDVPEAGIGAGLSDVEAGVQLRYELTRDFAPYVDVRYERKFGETSSIARRNGEDNETWASAIGIRFQF